MNTGKIAIRYTKAFFDFALEQDILEEAREDMALVAEVIGENRSLISLLESPIVNRKKKISILREIFSKHCHKTSLEFILLLARKDREDFLKEIALHFEDLYRDYMNITSVKLITAAPVSEEIRNEITSLVKKHTKATILLVEEVDPELIGGFILEFDDRKYDASLAREFDKLKKEFDINLYVREF